MSEAAKHFDVVVIGGGSGGLAFAKRSAGYGANVCVVEEKQMGGTCVNVGCVPKKVMYNTAHVREIIQQAGEFGFSVGEVTFDWGKVKRSRDAYIARLNAIYEGGLDKVNIARMNGRASFAGGNVVNVSGHGQITADHICIAVGGQPRGLEIPGAEHLLDSDGFFKLEEQPKKVGVIGAGYIAVELAGVFHGLGSDTSLFVRGAKALRTGFDGMLSDTLHNTMVKSGLKVNGGSVPTEVVKEEDGTLTLKLANGDVHTGFQQIVQAIGRVPLTTPLALSNTTVTCKDNGYIIVDEYQNTQQAGVYALGDVCGSVELTPMAIAAGRRLGDRLFGGMPTAKADYTGVPTVVFSHPVIATCGVSETDAVATHGADNIRVYNSTYVNLHYGTFYNGGVGEKPFSKVKMICLGAEEKVIGLHSIGMGSDEVLQGFAVAMKMGATKMDFDNCIAIHPTAAEEVVTLAPWGMAGKK